MTDSTPWFLYVDARTDETTVVAPVWVQVVVLHRGGTVWVGDRRLREPASELVMVALEEEPLTLRGETPRPALHYPLDWGDGHVVAIAVEVDGGGLDPPVVLLARRGDAGEADDEDEDEEAGTTGHSRPNGRLHHAGPGLRPRPAPPLLSEVGNLN